MIRVVGFRKVNPDRQKDFRTPICCVVIHFDFGANTKRFTMSR